MSKKIVTNAMRMLVSSKIEFEAIEYEAKEVTADFGMYISKLTNIPPEQSFKTLVARGDKTGVLVAAIPVSGELDLKKLSKVSGNKKTELVPTRELLSLTGYIRGGVSPVGMKKKYPTYVSEAALGFPQIAISGGACGITLKISPQDLQKVTDCEFSDITANLKG